MFRSQVGERVVGEQDHPFHGPALPAEVRVEKGGDLGVLPCRVVVPELHHAHELLELVMRDHIRRSGALEQEIDELLEGGRVAMETPVAPCGREHRGVEQPGVVVGRHRSDDDMTTAPNR